MLNAGQKPNKLNAISRKRDFQMIEVWSGGGAGMSSTVTNPNKTGDNEYPC
jgi:hypothetical protein